MLLVKNYINHFKNYVTLTGLNLFTFIALIYLAFNRIKKNQSYFKMICGLKCSPHTLSSHSASLINPSNFSYQYSVNLTEIFILS